MSENHTPPSPLRAVPWARALLLVPFLAMLWVPSYNRLEPAIAGIPFFYWYQLLWVIVSGVIIGVVYLVER